LAGFFWVSGQGLGGIFTGSGTDPNTGPLIILLALAMVPAVLPDPQTWRSPYSTLLFRVPVLALGGVVTLGLALFLAAAYPVAAPESTSAAMSGMTGMAGSSMSGSSGETSNTASCTKANNGDPRTGLDVTNTPNMIMSGSLGMNMNGADASAAAGLNTTKANWSSFKDVRTLEFDQCDFTICATIQQRRCLRAVPAWAKSWTDTVGGRWRWSTGIDIFWMHKIPPPPRHWKMRESRNGWGLFSQTSQMVHPGPAWS
jgi:hypothetical protein